MKHPGNAPLKLAFYKAPGRIEDRLIRWATGSAYSHVELVYRFWAAGSECHIGPSISASPRDGGVRDKVVAFRPDHWDIVDIGGWAPADTVARARAELGRAYDWPGVLGTFVLGVNLQRRDRWFCSELLGMALDLAAPDRLSPGDLFHAVSHRQRTHSNTHARTLTHGL